MTSFRKITISSKGRDGAVILRRALQPLKADGADARRQPTPTTAHLVVFPNGDYRYYNRNGVLARQRVSAERAKNEMTRDLRQVIGASLKDVTLGRV